MAVPSMFVIVVSIPLRKCISSISEYCKERIVLAFLIISEGSGVVPFLKSGLLFVANNAYGRGAMPAIKPVSITFLVKLFVLTIRRDEVKSKK